MSVQLHRYGNEVYWLGEDGPVLIARFRDDHADDDHADDDDEQTP